MEEAISPEMPFDLRQIYALQIVGSSLIDVMEARKAEAWSLYYNALIDLKVVVSHKFKGKYVKVNVDGNTQEIPATQHFHNLLKKASEVCNENSSAFGGYSHNPQEVSKIKVALMDIEEFLYSMIDTELSMMGTSKNQQGL